MSQTGNTCGLRVAAALPHSLPSLTCIRLMYDLSMSFTMSAIASRSFRDAVSAAIVQEEGAVNEAEDHRLVTREGSQ